MNRRIVGIRSSEGTIGISAFAYQHVDGGLDLV